MIQWTQQRQSRNGDVTKNSLGTVTLQSLTQHNIELFAGGRNGETFPLCVFRENTVRAYKVGQ